MQYRIEVITLAVADADAALTFYRDVLGFDLDVDWSPSPGFRVVQLTPPGSPASIQFGVGLTDAATGSARENYLVVTDVETAHVELTRRGATPGPVEHKADRANWAGRYRPGTDPDRTDYASSFTLTDPDGNTWRVQERGHRTVTHAPADESAR
ncbi:VOC family protein [Jiangella mangrovi]|uniref:Catechol 2,3-dioxygenase-like lactoylglutathione lyase family enzyme n=1 Tax=Jiangella mangrovi TaxID=1524084 RepID=A0A7W9GRM2_9ACTN|nr:VOC family protein [Jiangella mangrovi]MBB5788543.1 catechol 2,3-dioxygenase-like lactoylglutathione lyase family enzyme [Jiangella mangrovi]